LTEQVNASHSFTMAQAMLVRKVVGLW
jgi:hypothetical protein